MALDASIYQRFAPKSVADFDREYEEGQQAKQSRELNALRLLSGQRQERDAAAASERTNALRGLVSGFGADEGANALALLRGGHLEEATKYQKAGADRKKDQAEAAYKAAQTDKERIATGLQKIEIGGQLMGGVKDQATYDMARQQAAAQFGPEFVANWPPNFDPVRIGQAQQQAMSVKERLEQEWKAKGYDLDVRKQGEVESNNLRTDARVKSEGAANRGVTLRGQNLTDARARDLTGVAKEAAAVAKKEAATDKAVTKFSDTLQKEGIPEIEAALSGAEGVFSRYTDPQTKKLKDVPGIGAVKNALPDWAVSSEGKDVRESLSAVANIVLSARSGAAVTDQELRRLARELSNSVGAAPEDTKRAYDKFRKRFDQVKANASAGVSVEVLGTYQERGGIPIKRGGSSSSASSSRGSTSAQVASAPGSCISSAAAAS